MLFRFTKIFPITSNATYRIRMNRVLLKQRPSIQIQEKHAVSVTNLNSDFDQQSKPPGLNTDNLLSEKQKIMLEPYNYHESVRMYSSRDILVKGFNYWLKVPDDIVNNIEQVMTMTYEMAFMVDDMDDGSSYRRGLPACYKIFGVPRTQVSGRGCFPIMLKKLLHDFDNKKIIEIFADHFVTYWAATYTEINWRENMVCPSIDEYRQNCIGKIATATGMLMHMMQIFSDYKTDLSKLAKLIGLHQQWQNDCSVITEEEMWNSKGFCDDISEGKFTVAIIHAINSNTPDGRMVFHILRQRTKNLSLLKLCHSLLEKLGSLEFSRKCAIKVEHEIREEIERLGGNPILIKYLDVINSFKNEENIQSNHSGKWVQK